MGGRNVASDGPIRPRSSLPLSPVWGLSDQRRPLRASQAIWLWHRQTESAGVSESRGTALDCTQLTCTYRQRCSVVTIGIGLWRRCHIQQYVFKETASGSSNRPSQAPIAISHAAGRAWHFCFGLTSIDRDIEPTGTGRLESSLVGGSARAAGGCRGCGPHKSQFNDFRWGRVPVLDAFVYGNTLTCGRDGTEYTENAIGETETHYPRRPITQGERHEKISYRCRFNPLCPSIHPGTRSRCVLRHTRQYDQSMPGHGR